MSIQTILKIAAVLLALLLAVVGIYIWYVVGSYERIEDHLELTPFEQTGISSLTQTGASEKAVLGREYTAITWNIGFGAYSSDYSFFMDGGKYSRALSENAVYTNLSGVTSTVYNMTPAPDFMLYQEVDISSTRSYYIDQVDILANAFKGYSSVEAVNYDSAYLFYPLTQPHGKSYSAMLTMSDCVISSAVRRSLPIETGFYKFLDLDRAYSVSRIPIEGSDAELCLYNVHLSAYTSDGTIADEQLKMLFDDMAAEYAAGNYVICGGDFNKDLSGDASAIFGVEGDYVWAQPVKAEMIPEGIRFVPTWETEDPIPSCRNADMPYEEGVTFVLTVDGFVVSDNVTVNRSWVIDTGFAYTDHNPVGLTFVLN